MAKITLKATIKVFETMRERINDHDNSWSQGYKSALDDILNVLRDIK